MGASEAGNSFLAVGSAVEGIGQYGASEAQASYTKAVYDANAELYQLQAEDAIRKGDVDAAKYKRTVKSLLGQQRAALAASGVNISDVDSSAYNIQEETLKYGFQDVQQIKNNAFREALGLKTQGKLTAIEGKFKAATARYQGMQSLVTSGLKAASYGFAASNDIKGGK